MHGYLGEYGERYHDTPLGIKTIGGAAWIDGLLASR